MEVSALKTEILHQMHHKILIMGLPGSGKTTLAKELAPMIGAVHLNADEIRDNINVDLGFSEADRIEQAHRMGLLADIINRAGYPAIADFICPTDATRLVYEADYVIWCDRVQESRFVDTNALFMKPRIYNIHVTEEGSVWTWAHMASERMII